MRFTALIAVPAIALALAGCSAQEPVAKPSTSSEEVKPLFATDEEALAAAQAAYANYLQVSDQIARDGGANPERLVGLVSPALLEDEVLGFSQIANSGWHAIGSSSFDSIHLQNRSSNSIDAYLCIDHSEIRLHDSSEKDVTSAERLDRYPLVVTFQAQADGSLILETSDSWSGQNFC